MAKTNSERTTGNEKVSDIDPGGTCPAKGTRTDKTEQQVESGDRNQGTSSKVESTK